ncbi:hypothetical protein ACROYT_G027141 [Oculina patagonica]
MNVSYFHFLLIIVVLFIPRGDCLSCYTCTSQVSWDDCNSKKTTMTCSVGSSQCLVGTLSCTAGDVEKTVYYKRCSAPEKDCETASGDSPSCPKTPSMSWSFSDVETCCYGDNCNSGSSHSINRGLLGICMALTLWALALMR